MPSKTRPPRGPSPSAHAVIPTPRDRTADALLAQYRSREGRAANEAAARSIWPTSKPYDRQRDIDNALVAARRTRGIAEGRRLAARRERCALWLAQEGRTGAAALVRLGDGPEASFREAAIGGCSWPFCVVGGRWLDAWLRDDGPAEALGHLCDSLFRSPEWAALPWQREAG